jgi:uncharacterized protein
VPLLWVDHFLALTLAVLFPIRAATFGYRRLVEAAEDDVPRVRRWLYKQAMTIQWSLSAVVAGLWIGAKRPWTALGLGVPNWPAFLTMLGVAVAVVVVLLWQARLIARNDETLDRVLGKLDRVRRVLPHTRDEMRRFVWLSITAGICEELLYRGFLFFYLRHWLDPFSSWAAAAALFGLGHSYQGPSGVVKTGIVGLLLGAAYWVCGSIVPSMVLHAGGDVYSGSLAYAALSRKESGRELAVSDSEPPAA